MLQSIVLNIMFLSLTCSSHKERLKIEKLWGFGLFLFKKLRNITVSAFCCSCQTRWRGSTGFFSETVLGWTL